MYIVLTGAAGRIGSHTLLWLLQRGHTVLALDLIPLRPTVLDALSTELRGKVESAVCDLGDFKAFERILDDHPGIEGVIHFGAIPDPLSLDPRVVHNNNVVGSYNVLETSARKGIKRIAQASSANAPGLSFAPPGHTYFEELPVTENTPMRPEDGYAISKAVSELQATALTRFYPGLRIASLRYHLCVPDYPSAVLRATVRDGFAWTSFDACASSAFLSLTSEGWSGHEVFNIVAPEICWEGEGVDGEERKGEKEGTMALMEKHWSGRYNPKGVRYSWWEGNPRRSSWDCSKAEKLLGWNHDRSGDI